MVPNGSQCSQYPIFHYVFEAFCYFHGVSGCYCLLPLPVLPNVSILIVPKVMGLDVEVVLPVLLGGLRRDGSYVDSACVFRCTDQSADSFHLGCRGGR